MDIGFIILCPDRNVGGANVTLKSIENYAYDRESICVVGNNTSATELKAFKELCPSHKGKDTITSLVNVGMKKSAHEWAFILFAGSRIPIYLEHKLPIFVKNEKDILFPVVNRKTNFINGSFNGVLINTNFFKQVGDFPAIAVQQPNINDFEMAKMMWLANAMDKGGVFKAVVGMKVN